MAVIIIALTRIGAIYLEILKRREEKYERDVDTLVKAGSTDRASKASLLTNPAMIIATVIFIAGLGTVYFAGTMGVNECKAAIAEQKAIETKRKVDEFKKKQMFKKAVPKFETETGTSDTPTTTEPKTEAKGTEGYQSIFAPTNLAGQADSDSTDN